MRQLVRDFRKFILRGNVIDLAQQIAPVQPRRCAAACSGANRQRPVRAFPGNSRQRQVIVLEALSGLDVGPAEQAAIRRAHAQDRVIFVQSSTDTGTFVRMGGLK